MDEGRPGEGLQDLVPRLFAILTAKLEDAAAIAVEGQSSDKLAEACRECAGQLIVLLQECSAVAEAIEGLCSSA
jgi:hypothetical protein